MFFKYENKNVSMKFSFLFLIVSILFSSCSLKFHLEKRKYRKGFYFSISKNTNAQTPNKNVRTSENPVTEAIPTIIILNEKHLQITSLQTFNFNPKPSVEIKIEKKSLGKNILNTKSYSKKNCNKNNFEKLKNDPFTYFLKLFWDIIVSITVSAMFLGILAIFLSAFSIDSVYFSLIILLSIVFGVIIFIGRRKRRD